MNPKSGKAPKAVAPAAPRLAEDADSADPGEVEQIKAAQRKAGEGKYGSTPVKPHKAGKGSSWIEIEMVDENGQPVPGERYQITLPDGSVASGTLDEKGLARVEGIEPGTCQVTFSDLDEDAWEAA